MHHIEIWDPRKRCASLPEAWQHSEDRAWVSLRFSISSQCLQQLSTKFPTFHKICIWVTCSFYERVSVTARRQCGPTLIYFRNMYYLKIDTASSLEASRYGCNYERSCHKTRVTIWSTAQRTDPTNSCDVDVFCALRRHHCFWSMAVQTRSTDSRVKREPLTSSATNTWTSPSNSPGAPLACFYGVGKDLWYELFSVTHEW